MSQHYEQHAEEVVKGFLDLLGSDAKNSLGQEQLDKLSMMIESAISTAVLSHLETVADEISDLSATVRRRAERYDDDEVA